MLSSCLRRLPILAALAVAPLRSPRLLLRKRPRPGGVNDRISR